MKNNIYIGYDTREDIAYKVCENSIVSKTNKFSIKPLILNDLRKNGIYTRDIDKLGSTEFTFSRFLVPYLNNYHGWSLYCDCDFLFLKNIEELFNLTNDKYAVMCVQHDYSPKNKLKMDGRKQLLYPRKNWSSLVLWNNSHPSNKQVNLKLVNNPKTDGKFLHRFSWLRDEEIGPIPFSWNWLVGWYKEPEDGTPSAIHFTEGGPWFEKQKNCEYSDLWRKELQNYNFFKNVKNN